MRFMARRMPLQLLDAGLIDDLFEQVISLVTRAQAASAPLARTKKPAWKNLSFISGVTRTFSVSASSHLTLAGGVLAGASSTASTAKTKSL